MRWSPAILVMLSARSSIGYTVHRSVPRVSRLFSTGHQASKAETLTKDQEIALNSFRESQAKLKRLSYAEEVKTLITNSIGFGVLSTNSVQHAGYPSGSVVGFQLDERGLPFFSFSTMSSHTGDLTKDGRASLTIMANDFKGAAEGRVNLLGSIKKVEDTATQNVLRELYRARHKDAYWVDFGDFSFFRMENIEAIRFVGGFAMAGNVEPKEYLAAQPDPLAPFAAAVMKHMNEDHASSIAGYVRHYADIPCTEATIVELDRFGITMKAKVYMAGLSGGYSKIRVEFPREVTTRPDIKQMLVDMTNASSYRC